MNIILNSWGNRRTGLVKGLKIPAFERPGSTPGSPTIYLERNRMLKESECRTCLVQTSCSERCYEETTMIETWACVNDHKYERKNNACKYKKNKCPECGTYFTGITAGRWV